MKENIFLTYQPGWFRSTGMFENIQRQFCCQNWGFIAVLCIEPRDTAENSTAHKELSKPKYQYCQGWEKPGLFIITKAYTV